MIDIQEEIYGRKLVYVNAETRKSLDLSSISWRTRKAGDVICLSPKTGASQGAQ